MKTILLKFSGPLQAWGTGSHFENRYTDRYPSKSAVIGMIAASFGYRRHEAEHLERLNELDFAVRVDQNGAILRDYHIAKSVKRSYVTNRYYLQDAVFVVGIGSKDKDFIETIVEALQKPYFQPFMGRRSLPLNADFFLKTTEKDVIESLQQEPWHGARWYERKLKRQGIEALQLDIYADADLLQTSKSMMSRDRAVSFSYEARKHSFRPVAVGQVSISLEHDAFTGIGGAYVSLEG